MSTESEQILKKLTEQINNLVLQAHSSKNKEVSGLFSEIKTDIRLIRNDFILFKNDLGKLEASVNDLQTSYKTDVTPNLNTWNKTSDNQSRGGWIVITAVILAILVVIGIKV